MHHNYIIFPRSPSRYKHPCFLSCCCCCFRTSQKTARFCPFLDHRTVNLNRHPAVWLIIVPDMPTVSRAQIPAQQHQGGPLWAPSRTSIRPRSDPSTNASSDTDALNNMKAPRLLKAIKTQPLPSPHCAASPPPPHPPPVWRLTDGEIWKWFGQRLPNHPPQEQRAVDAVCGHLCGYMSRGSLASIPELRGSPSRLRRASGAGLWSEMLPRRAAGASPCFYCLEDRKETEVSLCWRKAGLQLWPKCMMGNRPL